MKKYILPLLIIIVAIGVRLWFVEKTNYTAEDALITFQFARNLIRGDGFSINPGQPIYGSTTPLLTLMLSGWLLFNKDIILGARVINLSAVIGGMIFLYLSIKNKNAAIIGILIIGLSANLYIEEMQGMEMPLLFLFMALTYYGFVHKLPVFAGVMAGLMLWTRVDAVFWVASLFFIYMISDYRQGFKYLITTAAVYLPWILFSWMYFGSPIPFTIIAKQVAYSINNPSYIVHLQRIVAYESLSIIILALLSIPASLKHKNALVFVVFAIVETTQLVLTGSTFFLRYFYMLTLVIYILIALGVAELISTIMPKSQKQSSYFLPLTMVLIIILSTGNILRSTGMGSLQNHQQEILIPMGEWLNANTPPGSTILLEHIGYVGWYADRPMFDEVGLVTPKVVDLHLHNVPARYFYQVFWPNYVVWSCGQGAEVRDSISKYYDLVKVFGSDYPWMCYEIRARKPNFAYILP